MTTKKTRVSRPVNGLVRPVHKTCPSWGETVCGIQLYARAPKIVERWDRTTCKLCLSLHKPNAKAETSERSEV